jgi:hypothetical protein
MAFVILECSNILPALSVVLPGIVGTSIDKQLVKLEGSTDSIFSALEVISSDDLATVEGITSFSPEMQPRKVNTALRNPKVNRFNRLLEQEMKKAELSLCPIGCCGYQPYPHNTKKTQMKHQAEDVAMMVKCMKFQLEEKQVCEYCKTASIQRALKENGD